MTDQKPDDSGVSPEAIEHEGVPLANLPERTAVERARQLALSHVDAEASARYYADLARWSSIANFTIELLIAIGTGSSIAAWAVWRTSVGSTAWAVLLGAVAVANLLKPMLGLGERIRLGENRATRWNELAVRLHRQVLEIRADGYVSGARAETLVQEFARFDELQGKDSPDADNWYFRKVRIRIKDKFPARYYWPTRIRPSLSEFRERQDGKESSGGVGGHGPPSVVRALPQGSSPTPPRPATATEKAPRVDAEPVPTNQEEETNGHTETT